jgi:lipopolysaccharide/colanic/teichoic acid biosynthesis glycosyltransferase
LAARGYKMVFHEAAVVDHLHSATLRDYLRKKTIIGYWKAQVVRRFPGRATKDSHTPQVMKAQMLLAALFLAAVAVGLPGAVFGAGWWGLAPAAALALIFLATTTPFVRKAWARDRATALASPALLFGRAMALSAGYAWGLLKPRRNINYSPTIGGLDYFAKRLLDLIGATAGLLFTLIAWPLLALLIKLDSQGPVFFKQDRVGERGQLFTMIKFRTMRVGAAEQWPELVTTLGLSEPVLKLDDDPRLTGVGRFLRRWSLDELPQFWNVLTGHMSLVGPRPEEPRVVAHYTDRHRRRLAVKPGMTGPMQIDARADLTLDERVDLELHYIEHYSIGRDLSILWRTIPVIVRGRGAR